MPYVIAAPEMLTAAATDLAGIESALSAAHSAAATRITAVPAAAEDEVSVAIASLFSSNGQEFQALSAQAKAFQAQFVQALSKAGGTYTAAEAANASLVSAPGLAASSSAPAAPLFPSLPSLSSVINGFVNWLNGAVNSIIKYVNQAINWLISFVNQAINAVTSFVNQALKSLNSFINSVLGSIRGIFPIL